MQRQPDILAQKELDWSPKVNLNERNTNFFKSNI
jgi:hypothetical protein